MSRVYVCMFTQIIEKKKYRGKVEKIKTIGSTYMAATGLGENQVRSELASSPGPTREEKGLGTRLVVNIHTYIHT